MRDHPVLVVLAAIGVIIVAAALVLGLTGGLNRFFYRVQKIDDATNYKTIKAVEDNCRAMMANYTKDCLTWQQYKDSTVEEQIGWANQAKMRANSTAAQYNEYILKNSFVWQDNIPADIKSRLDYIE